MSDLAVSIVDTPHFQRLHYIRQTGFSYKVFPGAHTTRFEHSIGVYGVTRMFLDHLLQKQPEYQTDCDARVQELICIAGLIHDLGHGPFSHLYDQFLTLKNIRNGWEHHEQRSIDLLRDLVARFKIPILDPEISLMEKMVKGTLLNRWFGTLINNQKYGLDMDKIDYVLRDCKNFGIHGIFDPMRIFRNARIIGNDICFCDRIMDEINSVFVIRNKMNRFIYRHPKILKIEHEILSYLMDHPDLAILCQTIQTKNTDDFLELNDMRLLSMIPREKYWAIECRKNDVIFPVETVHDTFIDKEWPKIVFQLFYSKKQPDQKFLMQEQEWDQLSCIPR